jgi:PAS domain S-box-containing protein
MTMIDFAAVFEALPSPYMLLDRNLCFVAANAAYVAATGRSFSELRGRHVMDVFPNTGPAGQRLAASFERVLATGEPDTIAYLPYPIPTPDGGYAHRYWTCVNIPLRDAEGNAAFVLQNTVDVTEFARSRSAEPVPFRSLSAETSLIERTREAEKAQRELEEERSDFQRLFQQAPGFFAVLSGPEHVFTFASDAYVRLVGDRPVLGRAVSAALPEVVAQGFVGLLDAVYRSGKPYAATGARILLAGPGGEAARERVLDFSYSPIRDPGGAITGIFVQGTDQTERNAALEAQRVLIDELNHRVKNALATVNAIAAQTLRGAPDPVAAAAAFEARVAALAGAHALLSDSKWADTEIGALVRRELPDTGQIAISGPQVRLRAKATIALALLLHELAVNARRHGSLSVPAGKLAISWREDEEGLTFDWRESEGPPVYPPGRRGFGTRMLGTAVTGEFGGELDTSYAPDGFSARIRLPREAYAYLEAADVA